MSHLAFDEFIEQYSNEPKIDWEAQKTEWIAYLSEFYAKVEDILQPYVAGNKLRLEKKKIELDEEDVGTYQVDAMDILLGNTKITLRPVGMQIIAAKGRIDMEGPKGIVRFVLVPKDASSPKIDVRINGEDETHEIQEPMGWAWKMSTPPPRICYIELTNDSFKDAFMDIVNG